jgi:hypothetical protein
MYKMDIVYAAKEKILNIIEGKDLLNENLSVTARTLTPIEAIGKPERDDYPILKGKEVMIEADFLGSKGQAFTDHPGNYNGSLKDVLELDFENVFNRAIFVASLNAVLKHLDLVRDTVHCKDLVPKICAQNLVLNVKERFGNPKIGFIGLQPGMVEELSKAYELRVVDLDKDNIGRVFNKTVIEDVKNTKDVLEWCDIILATGSTVVNSSYSNFLVGKPLILYGVTISGLAYLFDLDFYCQAGE